MASLRRSKNYASDARTPIFLYAILKQLDLRNIDWNAVADKLDISNGHAARMRYSRMKPQFEGVAAQPRTPRPKKEKTNSKPAIKDKGKGKRLLLEEEEARLSRQGIFDGESEEHDPAPKRIKRDATLDFDAPTQQSLPTPYRQLIHPPWSGPMLKFEDPTPSMGLPGIGPSDYLHLGKKEPEGYAATGSTFSPIIKMEPTMPPICDRGNVMMSGQIKLEPGTARYPSTIDSPYMGTGDTDLQGLNQIDAEKQQTLFCHSRSPGVETVGPSCAVGECRRIAMEMPYLRHNRPMADYFPPSEALPSLGANYMFSPLATSFEDLLTMPLQELQPDYGGSIPVRGADTRSVDTGIQHSQSTDDVTARADKETASPGESDRLDAFIDQSNRLDYAIRTGMNEEDPDVKGKIDQTTEIKRGCCAIASEEDIQESDDTNGNVLIKREIIEIDD
ncbi:uncharacterized protein A1O9_11781 [Exophiala aquamarina CBS 119918]|uniref:Myb-like DNA-binding domain-containing protein n=1 Tax=Exophiala aquamarina CBS 119918 TaxID=1182545 RepID=A0A072P992_9EURO|nr:uncharacterized protein A1O9_11781 [Exophiala aquamarina CBS 119918]KEF52155.1 hypothetical protein A1O9_11781 [Exophiala aquamarina CBS 119918]